MKNPASVPCSFLSLVFRKETYSLLSGIERPAKKGIPIGASFRKYDEKIKRNVQIVKHLMRVEVLGLY
jgi:hypothetical protein